VKYIIKGEPMGLVSIQEYSVWNESKATRLNYSIQLKNQHDEKPLLHGPLSVKVTFYFLSTIGSNSKKKKYSGATHIDSPGIATLLKVIEDLGRGIIFANSCHIARIMAEKYYDDEPRTEILFSKLKESDENF